MAFKWRHWGRMTGKLVCPIGPDTKLEAEATNQEVEIWGVSVVHLDSDFKINKMEVFYDPHELMASLVDARSLTYKTPEIDDAKILSSTDMRNLNLMESVASSDGFMTTNNEKEFDDNASTFEALVGEPSGHGLPATFKPTLSGRTPPDPTPKAPPSPSGREMHHEDFSTGQASGGSKITQGSNSQQLQSLGHGNTRNSRGSESPKSAHVSLSNGIADLPGGESALPSDNALLSALMEKPRKALPGSRCPFPHNA